MISCSTGPRSPSLSPVLSSLRKKASDHVTLTPNHCHLEKRDDLCAPVGGSLGSNGGRFDCHVQLKALLGMRGIPWYRKKLPITSIAPRTIHDLNNSFDEPLADNRQDIRLLRNSCTSREYRGEATWPSTARRRLRACARCAVAARSGLERSHQGSFQRHRLRSRVGVCGGHGCRMTS